jgi:hypothetical protein
MSQEQYAAMSPEQQASYWAQWQAYYAQYPQQPQQQDYSMQYQQQVMLSPRGLKRHVSKCVL